MSKIKDDNFGWDFIHQPKAYIKPIKQRVAYSNGDKLFRTPRAAAKSQAWGMILSKYGYADDIKNTLRVLDMKCECSDDPREYGRPDEICELHNRQNGYFRRLQKRLTSAILKANGYSENWRDRTKEGGEMTRKTNKIGGKGKPATDAPPPQKVRAFTFPLTCPKCGAESISAVAPGKVEVMFVCSACGRLVVASVTTRADGHGSIETVENG